MTGDSATGSGLATGFLPFPLTGAGTTTGDSATGSGLATDFLPFPLTGAGTTTGDSAMSTGSGLATGFLPFPLTGTGTTTGDSATGSGFATFLPFPFAGTGTGAAITDSGIVFFISMGFVTLLLVRGFLTFTTEDILSLIRLVCLLSLSKLLDSMFKAPCEFNFLCILSILDMTNPMCVLYFKFYALFLVCVLFVISEKYKKLKSQGSI